MGLPPNDLRSPRAESRDRRGTSPRDNCTPRLTHPTAAELSENDYGRRLVYRRYTEAFRPPVMVYGAQGFSLPAKEVNRLSIKVTKVESLKLTRVICDSGCGNEDS